MPAAPLVPTQTRTPLSRVSRVARCGRWQDVDNHLHPPANILLAPDAAGVLISHTAVASLQADPDPFNREIVFTAEIREP